MSTQTVPWFGTHVAREGRANHPWAPPERSSGRGGGTGGHSSRAVAGSRTAASSAVTELSGRRVANPANSFPSAIYTPPGWPDRVHPPGAPGWETTAAAFLLDCCPADYRGYVVLRRHPVVLARFAAEFVESQLRASREGLAGVRAGLGDYVEPEVVQQAADAWQEQTAALVRVRRSVALVEEALRGRVFIKKL